MQELPDWFIEPLYALHEAMIENTLVGAHFTFKCSADFGLRIGMAADSWVRIRSPFGIITLESARSRNEDVLQAQNRALCSTLATMTDRAHAAEQRHQASIDISAEAERLIMRLLTDTGPGRMVIEDRRVLIQAAERLRRIQRSK